MHLHVATRPFAALGPVTGGAIVLTSVARAIDLSSDVLTGEVYGGGGNSGAPYHNDVIELDNDGPRGHGPPVGRPPLVSRRGARLRRVPLRQRPCSRGRRGADQPLVRLFRTIWLTGRVKRTETVTITYLGAPAQVVTAPVSLR